MVLKVADAFNEFHDRINPGVKTWEKVNARRAAVDEVLRAAFPAHSDISYQNSWIIGSLGRKTASLPVEDIDIMVHLHVETDLWSRRYVYDSSDFLYRVRRSLNSESAVKKVGARGQAVRLFYADNLWVDVAAVEKYTSGDYAIPDGAGNWLTTNPLEHEAYLARCDAKLEGDLRRFIRILKQWNKAHSALLSSFHLEAMAARTFVRMDNNRRKALRLFFEYNTNRLSVNDPAECSGDLSSYLTPLARGQVTRNLESAYSRANAAVLAEDSGDDREAIRLWGIILGDRFPTYG